MKNLIFFFLQFFVVTNYVHAQQPIKLNIIKKNSKELLIGATVKIIQLNNGEKILKNYQKKL